MRTSAAVVVAVVLSIVASIAPAADTADDAALRKDLSQEYLLDRYASLESAFPYLNRTLVHCRDEGRGPALLLIHGSLQDLYDWDAWTKTLSASYRVVRLDLPGSGMTGRVCSGDYSIDNTMRTVDALIDRLGKKKFAFVGTSIGGVVEFRYAATRPAAAGLVSVVAVHDWNTYEFARGHIAYFRPGSIRRYAEALGRPAGRLFFAGEHCGRAAIGRESACESAVSAIALLLA